MWGTDPREKRESTARSFWGPSAQASCCLIWLHNGPYVMDGHTYADDSPYEWDHGCNGCAKAHPTLELRFDAAAAAAGTPTTLATLSHPLDKLTQVLLEAGAWPTGNSPGGKITYEFAGYLRQLRQVLRDAKILGHLVRVPPAELQASDAAYYAEQKTMEQQAAPPELGAEAQMVVLTGVAMAVDLFTLFQMKRASKQLRAAANSAAADRLVKATFSLQPLVNGNRMTGIDNYMYRYDPVNCAIPPSYDPGVPEYIRYERKSSVLLKHSHRQKSTVRLQPNPAHARFAWNSGDLPFKQEPDVYDDNQFDDSGDTVEAYCGQQIRLFWHPAPQDIWDPRKDPAPPCAENDYGCKDDPNAAVAKQFEIAHFDIDEGSRSVSNNTETRSRGHCKLSFSLVDMVVEDFNSEQHDQDDDDSEIDDDEMQETGGRRFRGECVVLEAVVDFKLLVKTSIKSSTGYSTKLQNGRRFARQATPPSLREVQLFDALNQCIDI